MPKGKKARRNRLSGVPRNVWPDGVIHHGVRLLVLFALAVGTALLFPSGPGVDLGEYQLGVVADRDLIAQVAFPVIKDPQDLAAERDAAVRAVPRPSSFVRGSPTRSCWG